MECNHLVVMPLRVWRSIVPLARTGQPLLRTNLQTAPAVRRVHNPWAGKLRVVRIKLVHQGSMRLQHRVRPQLPEGARTVWQEPNRQEEVQLSAYLKLAPRVRLPLLQQLLHRQKVVQTAQLVHIRLDDLELSASKCSVQPDSMLPSLLQQAIHKVVPVAQQVLNPRAVH